MEVKSMALFTKLRAIDSDWLNDFLNRCNSPGESRTKSGERVRTQFAQARRLMPRGNDQIPPARSNWRTAQ